MNNSYNKLQKYFNLCIKNISPKIKINLLDVLKLASGSGEGEGLFRNLKSLKTCKNCNDL